jgi:hypothetical protein
MGEDRGGEVEQGKTAGRREEFGEFSGEQYDGFPGPAPDDGRGGSAVDD